MYRETIILRCNFGKLIETIASLLQRDCALKYESWDAAIHGVE